MAIINSLWCSSLSWITNTSSQLLLLWTPRFKTRSTMLRWTLNTKPLLSLSSNKPWLPRPCKWIWWLESTTPCLLTLRFLAPTSADKLLSTSASGKCAVVLAAKRRSAPTAPMLTLDNRNIVRTTTWHAKTAKKATRLLLESPAMYSVESSSSK